MAQCPKCKGKIVREWTNKKKHTRNGICGDCGKTVYLGRVEQTETSEETGSKEAPIEKTATETGSKPAIGSKPARTPRRTDRQSPSRRTAAKPNVESGGPVPKQTGGSALRKFFADYIW